MKRGSKNVSYLTPGSPPNQMTPRAHLTRDLVKHLDFLDISPDEIGESRCTCAASPSSRESSNVMPSPFIVSNGSISKYLKPRSSWNGQEIVVKEDVDQWRNRFRCYPDSPFSLSTPKMVLNFDEDSEDTYSQKLIKECEAKDKPAEVSKATTDFPKASLLPTVSRKHEDIPSISSRTMKRVLEGKYEAEFMIIDCRFSSEYEAGHIRTAENFSFEECLLKRMFPQGVERRCYPEVVLLFYCEFSRDKGPKMFHLVREKDRQLSMESHESLSYPEMYLLEGGYKAFFSKYKNFCYPQAYKTLLSMDQFRGEVRRDAHDHVRWRVRV